MKCKKNCFLQSLRTVSGWSVVLVAVMLLSVPVFASGRTDQADARRRTITVTVDGKTTPCIVTEQVTVAEQLNKLDITLEELDTVTPALETTVKEGESIRVRRVRKQELTETGVIPFETIYAYSPTVTAGTEEVFVQGEDGNGSKVYELTLVDGKETEKVLMQERIDKAPVTKEVGTGFKTPLISPLNFEWSFNEAGEPLNAVKVLNNQRSSAYSAKKGAKTASGRNAIVGHVAVNPNVIPYGSKLFIQSADKNYIYGYAIAADTGTALLDGRVAVDIFYNTYMESVNHGIIMVDIYVLEKP